MTEDDGFPPVRRLMRVATALLALGLIALASGCGPAAIAQSPDRIKGDWVATAIRNGSSLARITSEHSPTARFASTIVAGSAGVNGYRAVFRTSSADLLSISIGSVTKIAGSPRLRDQENSYLSALADVRRYRVSDERLELLDGLGAPIITFGRAIPVSLQGSLWTCTAYNVGKQTVVSLVPRSTITVRFDAEGRLMGSGGVNQYSTSYRAVGASMTIDPLVKSTHIGGPPALMTQERRYLRALQHAARFKIDGDQLVVWGDRAFGQIATYELVKP